MMKSTFFRVALSLVTLCCSVFFLSSELKAQADGLKYDVTVLTNKAELVEQGLVKPTDEISGIFFGEFKAELTNNSEGTFATYIPLPGHEDYDNRWKYTITVKAVPMSGIEVKSIVWYHNDNPEQKNALKNNSSISRDAINGNITLLFTFAKSEAKPPVEEKPDRDKDEDEDIPTYTVTYEIVGGKGEFRVADVDEEPGRKFILEKGDSFAIEAEPEDDYEIDYVKYGSTKLTKGDFNYVFRRAMGNITKNYHFIVAFKKIGEASGVEDIASTALQVYPNPCVDNLYLSEAGSVQVYTLDGVLVLQQVQAQQTVDMSVLPQGSYVVKVTTATGVSTKQILKK